MYCFADVLAVLLNKSVSRVFHRSRHVRDQFRGELFDCTGIDS